MKMYFQRAIQPLTVTATLFGFALIEYPEGKPQRLLSLLCAIMSFILQVIILSTKFIYFDTNDAIFVQSISHTMLCYTIFNILVVVCFCQWHGKKYHRCLEAINEIDETLKGLGIETDYYRLRRVVVITLVTWISWICMLNIFDSFALSRNTSQIYSTIALLILNIPVHAPLIIDMRFWFFMGYAGTRFDCMSNALRELTLDDNDYLGQLRNKRMISVRGVFILNEKNKRLIWTTMHLYFRLCEILRDLTRVFETQLYMEIALSFQFVLCSMIFTFRLMLLPFEGNKYKYCALIWIWTVLHILKIFITNYICESVSAKALTFSNIAVRLLRDMDDEKMREDLFLIGLQAKYNPLRFSCLGLNYFGYQFLCEIVSTMVTTTVIVLQMKTGLE